VMAGQGRLGAPDFALLTDAAGTVVARASGQVELPAAIGGLPVVAEARTGIARDGLWTTGDKAYHLAAAPMFDGNALLGVVVQGWQYDKAMVADVCKLLSGPCGLTVGKTTIGDVPAEAVANQPYGEPSVSPFGLPLPLLLKPEDALRFMPISTPLYGGDNTSRMIHVVDRNAAFQGIATAQMGLLGLSLLMGLITAALLLLAVRAVQRPLHNLVEFLGNQGQGQAGFVPESELGQGVVLRLGKQINMLLQQQPTARGVMPPVSMPPAPAAMTSAELPSQPAAFASPPVSSPSLVPSMPAHNMASSSIANALPASLPGSLPKPGALASLPGAPPTLSGLFDGPDVAPSPPTMPSTFGGSAPMDDYPQPEATVAFQVPPELLQRTGLTPAPIAPPPPDFGGSGAGERTVVAQVPKELLAQVRPTEQTNAQDSHYKEVYEKFLQTRIECGEDTSDLTYDRFVAKLEKNKQTIMEKNNAKGVRFQVYLKEGKAALRAVPVRD
jgi:hypothetical protein